MSPQGGCKHWNIPRNEWKRLPNGSARGQATELPIQLYDAEFQPYDVELYSVVAPIELMNK